MNILKVIITRCISILFTMVCISLIMVHPIRAQGIYESANRITGNQVLDGLYICIIALSSFGLLLAFLCEIRRVFKD